MLLEASNLTKQYGGVNAVQNFDISVKKGELVGLIGPNGAGKTTTFNMLSGYVKPTNGQILLDGKNINNLPSHKIIKLGLSRTFQGARVFNNLSVLENVFIASQLRFEIPPFHSIFRTKKALKMEAEQLVKCKEVLKRFSLYESKDMIAGDLPYAHRSLLGIAMAIIQEPKILLLDEPLAGMNPQETLESVEIIKSLNKKGLTIIIVEHDIQAIMRLSDKIFVLNYGEKLAEGTPQQIQSNPDVIKAYLGGDEVVNI